MKDNKRIKILQIGCSNFGAGGRSVAIYTLCDYFDDARYEVHYLAHSVLPNTAHYEELLSAHKWHIDYCKADADNYIKRQFQLHRNLRIFFKNNNFDIVHVNADTAWEAMLYIMHLKPSIQKIIVHAHTAGTDAKGLKYIIKNSFYRFAKVCIKNKIDLRLACSTQAAEYLFGTKDAQKAVILKNGIDFLRFQYNLSKRNEVRKQLDISEDTMVCGNVGRLSPPKNQFYLLDVFAEILRMKQDALLLIVGDGDLKEEIVSKSKSLGIDNKVRFMGNRSDTGDLYQAMDVFLLTSCYEGFGIVNIEAQASGLPCFISDVVPKTVKINPNVEFLSVKLDAKDWAYRIVSANLSRNETSYEAFVKSGYDINQSSLQLQDYYDKLLRK